jgi:hypothetical protein
MTAAAAAEVAAHLNTNAHLALRARDAQNLRLNVRRCRIIHGRKILMPHDR